MPNRLLTKRRVIGARLVLNAMAEIARVRNRPTDYEDVMIRLAVSVGQSEGRHLTPSKVAQYVDLPRTTVLRRVAAMVSSGEMRQEPNTKVLTIPEEFLSSADAMAACRRISQMINNAAAALSKLDTKVIADQGSAGQSSYHRSRTGIRARTADTE